MKNNLLALLTLISIGNCVQAQSQGQGHTHNDNNLGINAPKHQHKSGEDFRTLGEIRQLLNSSYVKFMQNTSAYKFNVYKMFNQDKDVIAEFIYHNFNSKALNSTYFVTFANSDKTDFSELLDSAPQKDLFFWNIQDNEEAIAYYLDSFYKHQEGLKEKTANLPPDAVPKKP